MGGLEGPLSHSGRLVAASLQAKMRPMTQHRKSTRRINRVAILAIAFVAALSVAGALDAQRTALAATNAAPASSITTAKPVVGEPILINALDAELQRAMSSLGTDGAAAQQPKPYFLSYAVDDATSVSIAAEYGAITNSNQSRRPFGRRAGAAGQPGRRQHPRRPPQQRADHFAAAA